MKKKGILILLVLMLMVVMIGCKAEGQPQDEAPQATESNEVEPTAKVGEAQPMSANETREPTQEELFEFFENAYNGGKEYLEIGLTGDDLIGMEVCNLYIIFMGNPDIKQPANIEAQYREWRLANYPDEDAAQAPVEVQLFTDCNQTVYATGTVNIRASYSTNSTKLGSLTRGQSITCTGTGINDASGWSRVQLSDGTIAYMVSSYLSTTRPVQQSQPGNQQTGNNGTQQVAPPSGGTVQDSSGMFLNPWAGMTEEEKAAAIKEAQEDTQKSVDAGTGILH